MTKHSQTMPVGRPIGATSYQYEVAKAFGIVLRKRRLLKKLTQDELGHIAGIPGKHVSNIERGANSPTLSIVVKLAAALKVSIAGLMIEMEILLTEGNDVEGVDTIVAQVERMMCDRVEKNKT